MYHWGQWEIQTLYLGGATGGTFTLGDGTTDTSAIAFDASAATIETELEAIFGAGNVTVDDDTDFTITFSIDSGVTGLEADFASLTGGTGEALTETQPYESQEFKILWGTYRPPHAPTIFSDINVIPSAAMPSPVTIVQQGGNERKSANFNTYVETMAEYDALQDDHHAGNVKRFYGPESLEFDSYIRSLSPPEYVQAGVIRFSIVLEES